MAVLRAYPVDVSRGTRAMITVPVAGGALESVCGLLRLFIKAHQHCQGEGGQREQEGGVTRRVTSLARTTRGRRAFERKFTLGQCIDHARPLEISSELLLLCVWALRGTNERVTARHVSIGTAAAGNLEGR